MWFSIPKGTALKGKNWLPLICLWEQILSFKGSSHFEKGRNWRESLFVPVVSPWCELLFQRSGYAIVKVLFRIFKSSIYREIDINIYSPKMSKALFLFLSSALKKRLKETIFNEPKLYVIILYTQKNNWRIFIFKSIHRIQYNKNKTNYACIS